MHLLRSSPALSNDVEMLQTDVMRFFAILCLCLMAIFALVKTLPMAPPADRPTIAEPTDLKAEAQSLQIQIAALKKKLAATLTQVQAASVAAQQSTMQVKKSAKDEQEILARLANTQRELKIVTESLNQTRRELEMKPSKADPPKTPPKEAYILRFASDAGLQTLISGGQVIFYAVAGKKAWQLCLTGGRPAYIPAKIPQQIYEMETATVPREYAAAFQRQVAAFGPATVTWGVTLPVQTTASINRLIKGENGGEMVIMPDGEVILN